MNSKNKIIEGKVRTAIINIRKIREYRNYSQHYVAAKLSISQNAYSKIELFQSAITLNRLFQIAVILEVEVMNLLYVEHLTEDMFNDFPPIKG